MDDRKAAVALNTIDGFRALLLHQALAACGTPLGIVERARKGTLPVLKGLGPALTAAVRRLDAGPLWEKEEERARRLGAKIVTAWDDDYPGMLRQIPDPPLVLYVRGTLLGCDRDAVALVGSRTATEYGRITAGKIGRDLALRGVTVVSGMARGIDTAAHRGALEGGGRTIAVLGTGIDRIYPAENRALAQEIAARGALVTEFPFGSRPEKHHFPLRNRVVSGLSLGVVVVEAAERSGALITGALALDQGREVFAVPGNITSPRSIGPNRLLKEGAKAVTAVEDILEEFPRLRNRRPREEQEVPLSSDERDLLATVGREPISVDDLIRRSTAPANRTLSLIGMLESKGLITQQAGRRYIRH